MRPLVSAIVTSYNRERYLRRALQSALDQQADGLEVIAIDDASTDGSQDILRDHAGAPHLRVELGERNRGVSWVFNRGLQLARGAFVAFLGSDDYWLPGHLSGALEVLREDDAAFCYGRVQVVDAEDRDVTDREQLFGSAPDAELFAALLRGSNFVPFISCVMRRDVVMEAGGFDESLFVLQDYDLWLSLASRHPARFLDRMSAAFRWDGLNRSWPGVDNSVLLRRELAAILERWLERQPDALRRVGVETEVRRRLAGTYRRLAHRLPGAAERARCFRRSLHFDPRQPEVVGLFLAARLVSLAGTARRRLSGPRGVPRGATEPVP